MLNIKNFESRFFVKLLFFSFCLTGCLYQISDICNIYFSYKTTNFVSYGNQSEISLPAITICTEKQNLLKPEYLDKILRENNKIQNNGKTGNRVQDFLNNMTVREQFDALYEFWQVFNGCGVFKPIGMAPNYLQDSNGLNLEPYVDCESVVPIRRSIDYNT